MNLTQTMAKIESSLLEAKSTELVDVFIHIEPGSMNKVTEHLQTLKAERAGGEYNVLDLILVRLPVRNLYPLAEHADVIRIFGPGKFQTLPQAECEAQGKSKEDDHAGCGADSPEIAD